MRGLSFSGRLIILDESQNFTTDELVTAVTRLGEHSRIWVLGDPNQSDLTGKSKNDFVQFCNKLNDEECRDNGIESFDFDVDDIVRSEFCKFVVKKLEVYEHAVDYFKSPSSEWSPSS
jgi:phosphate starvation-inducible protein PhoH